MSEIFEIRKTRDGKIFAIKNIRQEFEDNTMILKADISGDEESAQKFLKEMANGIITNGN